MKVKFINYPLQYQQIKPEIDEAILGCLERGDLILRNDLADFERALAKYIGAKYAVGVASGTDALFLSLKAVGIGRKSYNDCPSCISPDEVITVSHTFIATIQVIRQLEARPILIDVKMNGLIDEDKLEEAITPQTKAIMPVHLYGQVCNMTEIMRIAKKHKLIIIEDAAQAMGAEHKDRKAGSFGLTGCFSFYPAKVLGCYGDGGAITTNDEQIYEKLLLLRNHWGKKETGICDWGYNSRLDNIQAAVLNVKLKYLPQMIKRRREIAKMYNEAFGIKDNGGVYQEYIFLSAQRDNLAKFLQKKGIEVLVRDIVPNHKRGGLRLSYFNLPMTEILAKQTIRLPIDYTLTNEQIIYVIKSIKEFLCRQKNNFNRCCG